MAAGYNNTEEKSSARSDWLAADLPGFKPNQPPLPAVAMDKFNLTQHSGKK